MSSTSFRVYAVISLLYRCLSGSACLQFTHLLFKCQSYLNNENAADS